MDIYLNISFNHLLSKDKYLDNQTGSLKRIKKDLMILKDYLTALKNHLIIKIFNPNKSVHLYNCRIERS